MNIIDLSETKVVQRKDMRDIFPKDFINKDLISKYILYAMNHFFEIPEQKYINGYIGARGGSSSNDYYLKEVNSERQAFQIIPSVVSKRDDEDRVYTFFNFKNQLKSEGSDISDENRVFSEKYWSWMPPINPDMFLNYYYYYWYSDTNVVYNLYSETNADLYIIGSKEYIYYGKLSENGSNERLQFENGMKVVFYNDSNELKNGIIYVVSGVSSSIELTKYIEPCCTVLEPTNINRDIIGSVVGKISVYNEDTNENEEMSLVNGLRVKFMNDSNKEYNDRSMIVEGVGDSIFFIDDENPIVRESNPSYITMERGSLDGNIWSKTNKWYHRDVLSLLKIKDFSKFTQATRPILCFNRNIELYNYGIRDRGVAEVAINMLPSELNGTTTSAIQNVILQDGMTLLFLKTGDNENNIYTVGYENDLLLLTPKINGADKGGKSIVGDGVYVRQGNYSGKYFYYTNINGKNGWVEGQQKEKDSQKILFNLYDSNGDRLDSVNYPKSSFKGSSLFEYKSSNENINGYVWDESLKTFIEKDKYENYIFNNTIESDIISYRYMDDTSDRLYKGLKYYKNIKTNDLMNDWYFNNNENYNYLFTDISYDIEPVFELDNNDNYFIRIDLAYVPDKLKNKKNNFIYLDGKTVSEGIDYIIEGRTIKLYKSSGVKKGSFVRVKLYKKDLYETIEVWVKNKEYHKYDKVEYKSNVYICLSDAVQSMEFNISNWTPSSREYIGLVPGYYYDLPLAISSNVDNGNVYEIGFQDCLNQFVSIMENQNGFEGNTVGSNNFNNIHKDYFLGNVIVQHSASIIKSMITEDTNLGVINAIEYTKNQYMSFKNKLTNMLNTYMSNGKITNDMVDDEEASKKILVDIISKINVGKIGLEPYYNNGVALDLGENLYIPSTPAYLGLSQAYKPFYKKMENGKYALIGHDGSYISLNQELFNGKPVDIRDYIYYLLETSIFNSMIKDENGEVRYCDGLSPCSYIEYYPGKFRDTIYSQKDYVKLYQGDFHKWATDNGLDYNSNDDYDIDNPFTWNYKNAQDNDGNILSGSYRKIYKDMYDTCEPNSSPWEMLGFGGEPSWWEKYYGSAPYTSNNISMWMDIENGIIRDGISKGEYDYLKRPGLVENYLPVDENGNLLDPIQIGIVTIPPVQSDARSNWVIGDLGKIEYIWTKTSDYQYTIQKVNYLMKPLLWLENGWDTENYKILFGNTSYRQIVNNEANERLQNQNTKVHNENLDGKYVRKIGNQQWFSDFLVSNKLDITNNYADVIRNANSRLSYRCGGYYQDKTLKYYGDYCGFIPDTNVHNSIISTITGDIFTYSGMIITFNNGSYEIDGYDKSYPYFKVLIPDENAQKTGVSVNGKSVFYHNHWKNKIREIPYRTKFKSIQELYDVICGYGKYLEEVETWYFNTTDELNEINDFRKSAYEFLKWTTLISNRSDVDGIALLLNPGVGGIGLYHNGMIDDLRTKINGSWSILDTNGNPIKPKELMITRDSYNTYFTTRTQGIALLKVRTKEYEELSWFDDKTDYGYVLFNSETNSAVSRLKVSGVKVDGWDGSYYAPGYIISGNRVTPNYEKQIREMPKTYDTDNLTNIGYPVELSKNMTGFRDTDYLNSLLLNSQSIFNFYKGMIREKGTVQPINKIQKSSFVSGMNSNMPFYEIWGVKRADIGQIKDNSTIELLIKPDNLTQNPQIVKFSTRTRDGKENDLNIDNIYWDDNEFLKKNENKLLNSFKYSNYFKMYPTAGFVNIKDTYNMKIVSSEDDFNSEYEKSDIGQLFWVTFTGTGNWDIRKKLDTSIAGVPKYASMVVHSFEDLNDIICGKNNTDNFFNVGDLVYIKSDNYIKNKLYFKDTKFIDNTEYITGKDEFGWFVVRILENNSVKKYENKIYHKGDIVWNTQAVGIETKLAYFKCVVDASSVSWKDSDWNITPIFEMHNVQMKLPNMNSIKSVFLVNNDTDETLSKVYLYNPLCGVFPDNIISEINYITPEDPVSNYNTLEWYDNKVGFLWWDLSKVRYVDYNQSDEYYKRKYWGKQVLGSEIIINEWTKSSQKPDDRKYVEQRIYNSKTNSYDTYYFYWSANVGTIPNVSFRKYSANIIANIINNPTKEGLVWLSPCSIKNDISEDYSSYVSNSFLITNYNELTLGKDFVIQINLDSDMETGDYTEWKLLLEDSDDEFPEFVWNKLVDSIVGKDELNNLVPNPMLSKQEKLGISLKPRQTMFDNVYEARKNMVQSINGIFASRDITSNTDIDNADFIQIFNEVDEVSETDYDMSVGTHEELKTIVNVDEDIIGKRILVKSDEIYDGIWTLWLVRELGNAILIGFQKFDMRKYWKYVDIYSNDLLKKQNPIFEGTMIDVLKHEKEFKVGDLIKVYVKTNTENYWVLYVYQGNSELKVVAQQNAGVELLDTLYTYMDNDNLNKIYITYYQQENGKYVKKEISKYEYINNEVQIVWRNILTYF